MTDPAEIIVYETTIERVPDTDRKARRLHGRAVPYDVWTNRGWFMESVRRGSLDKSISEAAAGLPLLLFHDDHAFPVGVSEDWDSRKDALYGWWRMSDTPEAERAWSLADDGSLRWLSVGISPIRNQWDSVDDWNPDLGPEHMDRLTRVEARLVETSMVTTPAFATAEIMSTFARKLERTSEVRRSHNDQYPNLAAWKEWRQSLRG